MRKKYYVYLLASSLLLACLFILDTYKLHKEEFVPLPVVNVDGLSLEEPAFANSYKAGRYTVLTEIERNVKNPVPSESSFEKIQPTGQKEALNGLSGIKGEEIPIYVVFDGGEEVFRTNNKKSLAEFLRLN